jgi:phosphate uptake regulator
LFLAVRKVQKVGDSTFVVSLPKKWIEEVGVSQGDILSFRKEADGTLIVTPGLTKARPNYSFRINADLCKDPGLLGRTIMANYMVGHDTLQIVGKKPLSKEHDREIQQVCNRLTGVSIIEYGLESVTLQSFVDPSRTSVYGLLRRLQIILSGIITATAEAISGQGLEGVDQIVKMEEEADRIYYMIVRQLLLALSDRGMAKDMGIDNPLYILGDRVVAKSLEEMADITTHVAREIRNLSRAKIRNAGLLNEIAEFAQESRLLMEEAFEALVRGNASRSNQCIQEARKLKQRGRSLTGSIRAAELDPGQTSLIEYMTWNLLHLSKYVEEIAEVAANRQILSPSQLCTWQQVEASPMARVER